MVSILKDKFQDLLFTLCVNHVDFLLGITGSTWVDHFVSLNNFLSDLLDVNNRRLVNPVLQWLGAGIMLRRTCKQTMAGVDRNLAVCFLEHSYIRGLKDFMYSSSDFYNFRLDRDSYNVTTKFRGGLQVQQLASIAHFGRDVPDICFLQIGGNDIGSFTDDKIVSDKLSFSAYLLYGVGVQMVIIGQLLRRYQLVVHPEYNDSVIYINRQLERRTRHRDDVSLWKHRGFLMDF